MATTTNITSTYAGQDAGIYISSALKSADTIEKGAITVLPNIKFKAVLHKLELADGTVDFACDFTPQGSVSLSEAILTPKKLMLPLELCKENFVTTWEAESMGFGANNESLPSTFQEYFVARVLEAQSVKIDSNIWTGDASVSGEFGGIIPLLVAAGTGSNQVTGVSVAVTAANVIEVLGGLYDAIPEGIYGKEDTVWVISQKVAKSYKRALSALGFRNDYSVGDKPLDFEGMELTVINGTPSNFSAIYQVPNVYFGTGLLNDSNEIAILDMKDKDLSDNVRFKLVYTAGVQIVNPAEVTFYYVA